MDHPLEPIATSEGHVRPLERRTNTVKPKNFAVMVTDVGLAEG
jgi:hypothetical protein